MTTTESARSLPCDTPRFRLTALEWRLWLTVVLSGVYFFAWASFATRTPPTPSGTPSDAPMPIRTNVEDRFVWITDLPPSQRPPVSLPAGWSLTIGPETREPALTKHPR